MQQQYSQDRLRAFGPADKMAARFDEDVVWAQHYLQHQTIYNYERAARFYRTRWTGTTQSTSRQFSTILDLRNFKTCNATTPSDNFFKVVGRLPLTTRRG
jgi:hypothetical protein